MPLLALRVLRGGYTGKANGRKLICFYFKQCHLSLMTVIGLNGDVPKRTGVTMKTPMVLLTRSGVPRIILSSYIKLFLRDDERSRLLTRVYLYFYRLRIWKGPTSIQSVVSCRGLKPIERTSLKRIIQHKNDDPFYFYRNIARLSSNQFTLVALWPLVHKET